MSQNAKLPLADVPDPESQISSIIQTANKVHGLLVTLGLEYANKITGKFSSVEGDNYFHLRDSILYRLNALLFHLRLLLIVQKNHLDILNKDPFDQEQRSRMLFDGSVEQYQLFDSIVFHSISLFDYFGNLIDYVCGDEKRMTLKWNGVVKSLNDPKNPLSGSPIAPVAIKLHREFVNKLYEHRSDLIHYSSDLGGAETTLHIKECKSDFTVFAPKRVLGRFPALKMLSKDHHVALRYVAFWVCQKTIDGALDLIKPMFEHIEINRRTPQGSAIFLFGKDSKPQAPTNSSNDVQT